MKKSFVFLMLAGVVSLLLLAGCDSDSSKTLSRKEVVQKVMMASQNANEEINSGSRGRDFTTSEPIPVDYSEPGMTLTGSLEFTNASLLNQEYSGILTTTYTDYSAAQYTLNGQTVQDYEVAIKMSGNIDDPLSIQLESMTLTITMNGEIAVTGDESGIIKFNDLKVQISVNGNTVKATVISGNVTFDGQTIDVSGDVTVE